MTKLGQISQKLNQKSVALFFTKNLIEPALEEKTSTFFIKINLVASTGYFKE
jgi:hypothetical protein